MAQSKPNNSQSLNSQSKDSQSKDSQSKDSQPKDAKPGSSPHSTQIKVCGITRAEDATAAVEAGVNVLGFNFAPISARFVDIQAAAALVAQLPAEVSAVGVFVDPEPQWVRQVLDAVDLRILQFHGQESEQFCASFELPYWKALAATTEFSATAAQARFHGADALLLDSMVNGQFGGTGQRFDAALFPSSSARRWILSGGLNPDNVQAAVQRLRPYAADVSGGVEGATKGHKDATKIQEFVAAVRAADSVVN